MTDLSPEALTEGPLREKQKVGSTSLASPRRADDIEASAGKDGIEGSPNAMPVVK
jgi:hypothetical protein